MTGRSPFRSGVETGCLIAFGIFLLLILIGMVAQWGGAA